MHIANKTKLLGLLDQVGLYDKNPKASGDFFPIIIGMVGFGFVWAVVKGTERELSSEGLTN